MKVVYVTTGLDTGGAEMMLYRLIQCSGNGVVHGVVSLMQGGSLSGKIRAAGVEVDELGIAAGSVSLGGTLRLVNSLRRHRPDIIHGWMYHGNLAATVGSLMTGRQPVIWAIHHSLHTLKAENRLTQGIIRSGPFLSRSAAAIVYVSRVSAAQHESLGYPASKTVIIPNGFDCTAFHPDPTAKARLRSQLGIPPGRIVIGMVGRVHPIKDHPTGIRAVGRVLRAGHDVHLVIIGRGADAGNDVIVRTAQDAGISGHLSLLGERHDVAALMPGLDLLALSSAGEAFPTVLGEAMACGVPCVATDLGDSALIVGSTGVVVPPRDPGALAEGLDRLIALRPEGRRQLGQAARQRIIANFSIAEVIRQYETVYQRVAERQ